MARRLAWGMALSVAALVSGLFWLAAMRQHEVVEMPPFSQWPVEVRAAAEAVRSAPGARKEDLRTLEAYPGDASRRKLLRRRECWLPSHPVPGFRQVLDLLGAPNLRPRGRSDGRDGYVANRDAAWEWNDAASRGEADGEVPPTPVLFFACDHDMLAAVVGCHTSLGY